MIEVDISRLCLVRLAPSNALRSYRRRNRIEEAPRGIGTFNEIMAMLAESELSVCFLYPNTNHVIADGRVYAKVNAVHVELYTDEKNPPLEEKLETVLDRYGIVYSKSEVWIADERLYEVLYTFELEVDPDEEEQDQI